MKKKVVSVLLCVAMTATMLLGCSAGSEKSDSKKSSKSESGGTTEMKVDGDATTINVWTFIELHQKFYTEMAKKWNEAHPDKKVKLVLSNMQYDDMHNKLSLALESGKGAPDVVDIELGKFPSFTNGKIGLMDLTDAIAPYKDNIVESRLDIYGKDGKYYGFPTHVGTTVAFYNDDLLKEAGKRPVIVKKDVPGFLANRMQHALFREALNIIEQDIADPADVDDAIKYGFGMRLGICAPVEVMDMGGLDLTYNIHSYLFPHLCNSTEPSKLLTDNIAKGNLGFKTGQGLETWSKEDVEKANKELTEGLIKVARVLGRL